MQGMAPKQPLSTLGFLSSGVSTGLKAPRVEVGAARSVAQWGVLAGSQGQRGGSSAICRGGREGGGKGQLPG